MVDRTWIAWLFQEAALSRLKIYHRFPRQFLISYSEVSCRSRAESIFLLFEGFAFLQVKDIKDYGRNIPRKRYLA